METARAIADVRGIAVTPVQDLIECDVGEWEGLSWPDIEARDPIAFRRFMDDPASHPYQGGESLSDVAARAIPALQGLIHSHPGSTLVVVAHNVVNRAYLATLLGIPLSRARSLIQANCGLNLVRSANGRAELVTLNSTWHLSTGLPNDPRVV
jgi:broad specificity phosphatase PhoE